MMMLSQTEANFVVSQNIYAKLSSSGKVAFFKFLLSNYPFMKTISLKELLSLQESQQITTRWRVDNIRKLPGVVFIILRQKYETIQLVLTPQQFENNTLVKESVIQVTWQLTLNPTIKLHGREIVAEDITIINAPLEELPIDRAPETYPGLDQRLNHRHISLREPKLSLVFEIMSFAEYKLREFCNNQWFIEIHSPKLLWAPSESGAELFSIEYFGKTAYLAQSPQFYKQMAIAAGFGKVLEIWPVFRANPSFTSRHDTEFTSVDFEISNISSHEEIMKFEEEMIVYLLQEIQQRYGAKIHEFYDIDITIPTLPFPRISFQETVQILEKEFGLVTPDGEDISSEGEKKIFEYVTNVYNHEFVFIPHYPISVRPFYHMRDAWVTKSYDLLYKWLEITSWAQREHRYDILAQQATEKWLSLEHIQFYLDFFKHGIPAHGGFGFGFTRFFMQLLNFSNVREVTFLPRDPKRLSP